MSAAKQASSWNKRRVRVSGSWSRSADEDAWVAEYELGGHVGQFMGMWVCEMTMIVRQTLIPLWEKVGETRKKENPAKPSQIELKK